MKKNFFNKFPKIHDHFLVNHFLELKRTLLFFLLMSNLLAFKHSRCFLKPADILPAVR